MAVQIGLLKFYGPTNQLGIPLKCRLGLSKPSEAKVLPFWSAFPQDSGVESHISTKAELHFTESTVNLVRIGRHILRFQICQSLMWNLGKLTHSGLS